MIEKGGDALIDDAIADAKAIAATAEDASIDQLLKLIGDGLRFHADSGGEVGNA